MQVMSLLFVIEKCPKVVKYTNVANCIRLGEIFCAFVDRYR